MQVNNAGLPGGKLVDGNALLRKVGLLSFSIKKLSLNLINYYISLLL